MKVQKLAQDILNLVGGRSNVIQLEHCSTRLRFNLVDEGKAKLEEIKKLPGVLGTVQNVQTQIIVGSSVADIYNEIIKMLDEDPVMYGNAKKQSIGKTILDYLVSIFQPLIPAIAGGGILKSFLMLGALFGLMDKEGQTYKILLFIGDAPLRFLPLLVAVTTARKLKSNQLVALATVATLLTPDLATMLGEGASLFGLDITNVNYAYQVFPAILAVFTYSYLEKFFTKITPTVVRNFLVPMFSTLITVPLTLFVLGPLGFTFGQGFASVIMFLFSKFGWIAVALLASFLPFMVVTGMHKAMIPYVITALGQSGKEIIYNAASLAHNISESGANFAVALRSKNNDLRSTAISSGVSALFGITEPALYGVTILHRRVLYGVMAGAFIGGASLGLMAVEAYVAVGPGLATLSMFISESLPNNFRNAVVGLVISFIVSFVTTYILWKEPVDNTTDGTTEVENPLVANDVRTLSTPLEGTLLPLENVNDEVFASKMLGTGIAIKPTKGELYAPVDAEVKMIYKTKHAIGLLTEDGTEILIHIGINTVNLEGKFFDVLVKEGQKVNRGDLLVIFNVDSIVEAGFDSTTILLFTKPSNLSFNVTEKRDVKQFEYLLTIQ